MRITKKLTLLLCALIVAFGLTACGGKDKEVSVDINKLAEELQTAVTSDTLSQTASEITLSAYYLSADDVENSVSYASSGSTACEIAVIQSKDSSKTGDVEKLLQSYVDSRSELFASYNEGEVSKLDKAVIKSAGAYTVLCVCDDTDKANEVLKKYGF